MRVLLVDDETNFAEAVKTGLEADGIGVDIANDGVDGLWQARSLQYDAIVLDIMLPGINGYKFCRELRSTENWTPILMLSAKNGDWDQAEALDTGADDYLSKPVSLVVLSAHLRALTRRNSKPRPSILQAGDIVLDPAARSCRRADTAIKLTPREFAVLEVLLSNAGDVVTKHSMLDAVWGCDHYGDTNVVELYIGYLRRKVDLPFSRQSIETVRGAGYRIRGDG